MMYPRARLGDPNDTAKGYQIPEIQYGGRIFEKVIPTSQSRRPSTHRPQDILPRCSR